MAVAEKSVMSHFPVDDIQVAAENDLLYDNFGLANRDDLDLALSIRDGGIQEPLVISFDNYLLSGHRRLAAAKCVGLDAVPVRQRDIYFFDLGEAERLKVLREYNQQREKSPGERIREKLLEIDPDQAYETLQRRRIDIARMGTRGDINVQLGAVKKRARITTIQFLDAVVKIINENEEYWPLTDRRIHYLLLNDPPLRHDKKPKSRYVNDKGSYKAVTNLLLRARLTGDIPWQAIEDPTRPIQIPGGFSSAENFIAQETDRFLMGYHRNLMQGQPCHVEIMLEKNALRTAVESVASEYCIPVTTGRGFSSLSPRYDLYIRFQRSGKDKLVLLMLTDFDPDGEEIATSFARSLRDDFGLWDIHPVKVALTAEDVRNYDLPSDMDAKVSSPNYQKFIAKYGSKVVELDAAPVKVLQAKLRDAIHSVIDIEEYNAQIEIERQEAAEIEARRRVLFDTLKGGQGNDL